MHQQNHSEQAAREGRVVEVLCTRGRERVVQHLGGRRDTCVATLRIALLTLDALGLRGEAIPVVFHLMNRPMRRLVERHRRLPQTTEEAAAWRDVGAWSVTTDTTPREDRFNGHLILATDHYLADPSIDQAARPEEGLVIKPWWMGRPEGFPERENEIELVHGPSGARIDYRVQRRPSKDWTGAPDWGFHPDDPIVREVVALAQEALEE